jgi:hypothetical protein
MFVLYCALALCPGEFPAELGSDYVAACGVLGLDPDPHGYAIYLVDTMIGRRTLISHDLDRLRSVTGAVDEGRPLLLSLDESDATEEPGWPDQLGGVPWCQFCRNPRPAWSYDGPRVEVLLSPSLFGTEPWPDVLGAEVTGRMDWYACDDCQALIESADYDGLWERSLPYSEPMPVQAAWREFWVDHGPVRPQPPPEPVPAPSSRIYVGRGGWGPAQRRYAARELARDWSIAEPLQSPGGGIPEVDLHAHRDRLKPLVSACLSEAWGYASAVRPPPGAVTSKRVYRNERLITAAGRGWSLVARTDGPALLLHDGMPYTGLDITRDQRFSGLLDGLTGAASRDPR